MAVYRHVHVSFWQDSFVLDLTPEEKYFYLYLMTNSKTTQCGIYELPKRIIETETGYNRETVDKLLKRFIDYGKIDYNEGTKEVALLNWMKYNATKSPKVLSCIKQETFKIKHTPFRRMVEEQLVVFGVEDSELYRTANKAEIMRSKALRIFQRDGFKCKRCGSMDDLTIDHIFPRNIGGSNADSNLRVLCRSCNSKRPTIGNKLIEDLALDGLTLDDIDTLSKENDTVSDLKGEKEKQKEKQKEKEKYKHTSREEDVEHKDSIPFREIIDYLNEKANKRFMVGKGNRKMISGRWSDGYRLDDFKLVIDKKVGHWKGDAKMDNFLRPSTLFSETNFQNYINESWENPYAGNKGSGIDPNLFVYADEEDAK